MALEIWTEKYRPKTLDDYVWKDANARKRIETFIEQGSCPNLLFCGKPGTGKTSLQYLILNLLDIPKTDILYINCSKDRGVNDVENKINNFIDSWALGPTGIKYILLCESDGLNLFSQRYLRELMEVYSTTTRFILTANYRNKIIPALQEGRCQVIDFDTLDRDEYTLRAANILIAEGIEFEFDTLNAYVNMAYPDLRKCISLLQKNTVDNTLTLPSSTDNTDQEYLMVMYDLFKKGKFLEARNLVTAQASTEEYPEIYRYFYNNLSLFGSNQEKQDDALLIIRKAIVNHALVSDVEINLSACICELMRIEHPYES